MINFLRRQAIFVKPVEEKWGVLKMTYWESFLDDISRSGLRVAVHNIIWLWKNRNNPHVFEAQSDNPIPSDA